MHKAAPLIPDSALSLSLGNFWQLIEDGSSRPTKRPIKYQKALDQLLESRPR